MPYSSHSGKDYIKRVVSKIKRDRVLDVGCGSGTYARMFPDATFVGVEVWEPYVAQFGLNDLYEKIIVADARTVDYKSLGRFDVAFLGDVLEHMEKEEAKKILDQVKEIADAVIVSIPIGYFPQDEYEGNKYQIHVTDNWTDEDFRATFGEPTASYIENEIGVYYWLKNKPKPAIVTCTVHDRCTPVLRASIEAYCPEIYFIIHKVNRTTFGESFNAAMLEAFREHDEIIIVNDDVVLTPHSYRLLMEDVEALKAQHGEKLGFVAAHTDSSFPVQNIRFQNNGEMDRYRCKWSWENDVREEEVVAPIFAWISRKAFEAAQFPPLNWYSDDVICRDLGKAGFRHFVSRSYVHHVGSQTVGHDDGANSAQAEPWLRANRPDYADMWFGERRVERPKKPLKICVYAISKNEEKFVERWAQSAQDADLLLVADTGSIDNTVKECKENGVVVHQIFVSPWRFDRARDASLALIPEDIDICVSLDLDEVMEPGWREEIERLWTPQTSRMQYMYDWGGGLSFKYEKIHARKGYHWHHPCHEVIRPDGRFTEVLAETDKLMIRHLPDQNKSRGHYLALLRLSVEEDPICPRNAFYYARELSFHGQWDEAISECEKYLMMPGATWPDERAYALRVIGKCYEAKGEGFKAEAAYWRAVFEAPHTREAHVALAQLYHDHQNWAACYASAHRALVFKERQPVYTSDPKAWGSWPHDLLALAAWNLGLRKEAVIQGQIAVSINPDDERLRENLKWFTGEKT